MDVTLDGEMLTQPEIKRLLAQSDGLAFIRGKWVEIDHERLSRTLDQFEAIERRAAAEGLSFGEAMRLLAGAEISGGIGAVQGDIDWSQTVAGPWLAQTLAELRRPDGLSRVDPGRLVHGTLRAYQHAGVQWLHLLARLGLGACLADDMGLGKTIQVLSLLLVLKEQGTGTRKPSLLVAPASLLANWAAEISRFAPSLRAAVIHPSALSAEKPNLTAATDLTGVDLAITSYGCAVESGRHRRGASHQKSSRQADQDGQAAQSRRAHCPDRHADREPPRRSLVDLRFHQSGTVGVCQAILHLRQAARRAAAQSLRPASRVGASLYPAPHEDRQEHHR
jgi:hypothetical protein